MSSVLLAVRKEPADPEPTKKLAGENAVAGDATKRAGQGRELSGQQLESAGTLRGGWFFTDRQQRRRKSDKAVCDRAQGMVVQRYAPWRYRQCADLQLGRNRQGQRPRALYVAAPCTGTTVACAVGG